MLWCFKLLFNLLFSRNKSWFSLFVTVYVAWSVTITTPISQKGEVCRLVTLCPPPFSSRSHPTTTNRDTSTNWFCEFRIKLSWNNLFSFCSFDFVLLKASSIIWSLKVCPKDFAEHQNALKNAVCGIYFHSPLKLMHLLLCYASRVGPAGFFNCSWQSPSIFSRWIFLPHNRFKFSVK